VRRKSLLAKEISRLTMGKILWKGSADRDQAAFVMSWLRQGQHRADMIGS
jgi:hypothetical protein